MCCFPLIDPCIHLTMPSANRSLIELLRNQSKLVVVCSGSDDLFTQKYTIKTCVTYGLLVMNGGHSVGRITYDGSGRGLIQDRNLVYEFVRIVLDSI